MTDKSNMIRIMSNDLHLSCTREAQFA